MHNADLSDIYNFIDIDSMDADFNSIVFKTELINPNYEYIKRESCINFSIAIIERNVFEMTQYTTIKFTIDNWHFHFDSEMPVLISIKTLQPIINE